MKPRTRKPEPRQAHFLRADVCPHGFPVVVMVDAKGVDFAEAHIEPDRLEEFIAALRKAKADAEAAYRKSLI
jgi:hypothetical protein